MCLLRRGGECRIPHPLVDLTLSDSKPTGVKNFHCSQRPFGSPGRKKRGFLRAFSAPRPGQFSLLGELALPDLLATSPHNAIPVRSFHDSSGFFVFCPVSTDLRSVLLRSPPPTPSPCPEPESSRSTNEPPKGKRRPFALSHPLHFSSLTFSLGNDPTFEAEAR